MSFLNAINTSATALTAQTLRMDVISENIANVNTTRTENGTPYKRKTVLFEAMEKKKPFSNYFTRELDLNGGVGAGVRVTDISVDNSQGTLKYDPSHPDADKDGYVEMPNVNIVEEMVNMISASRSYEANITAMNTTKGMVAKTFEIGN